MLAKRSEREWAIILRKQGKTYSEILGVVPVAKSTLSIWLRDVGLAKQQRQRITTKRMAGQKKGAEARKEERMMRESQIIKNAIADIGTFERGDLFLIGIALYWAEGSKAKPHNVAAGLNFANSDPDMIRVYLAWLIQILHINRDRIRCSIYIHENHKHRIANIKHYWMEMTQLPEMHFKGVYFKKHKPKTTRRNIDDEYCGLLRIYVRKSTDLNRMVRGWTLGIAQKYGTLS